MIRILLLLTLIVGLGGGRAHAFDPPEVLLETTLDLQLARTNDTSLQFDNDGNLHLVYFIQDLSLILPDNQIWYQQISNQPMPPERVNDGPVGGRHPRLTLTTDGTPYVTWQDNRHTTADNSWIDNIEIYADRRLNGSFQDEDIRISESMASHVGDNSFVPAIHAADDGRIGIAWYDFNRTGTLADLHFRESNEQGEFVGSSNIDDSRLLPASDEDNSSYWMPTLVSLSDQWLIYAGYRPGINGFFQLREITVDNGNPSVVTLSGNAGSFLDPPRVDELDGKIVMAFTGPFGNTSQVFFHARQEDSSWTEPIQISDPSLLARQPDVAIHPDQSISIVWEVNVGDSFEVHWARLSPDYQMISSDILSPLGVDSRTPSIAVSPQGESAVVWIESDDTQSRLVLLREQPTSVLQWGIHD